MDAVFRPSIDTPFSQTTFDDLLLGDGSNENPLCWMKRKTSRMLLQQHWSLSDPRNLPGYKEVALLERE